MGFSSLTLHRSHLVPCHTERLCGKCELLGTLCDRMGVELTPEVLHTVGNYVPFCEAFLVMSLLNETITGHCCQRCLNCKTCFGVTLTDGHLFHSLILLPSCPLASLITAKNAMTQRSLALLIRFS